MSRLLLVEVILYLLLSALSVLVLAMCILLLSEPASSAGGHRGAPCGYGQFYRVSQGRCVRSGGRWVRRRHSRTVRHVPVGRVPVVRPAAHKVEDIDPSSIIGLPQEPRRARSLDPLPSWRGAASAD